MGGAILVKPVLQVWAQAGVFLWNPKAVHAEKEGLAAEGESSCLRAHASRLSLIRDQNQTQKTAERGGLKTEQEPKSGDLTWSYPRLEKVWAGVIMIHSGRFHTESGAVVSCGIDC